MTDPITVPSTDVWTADWLPRLVAFDLDDTLAPSKSALDPAMIELLDGLLGVSEVCIISGGQIAQFRAQVIDRLVDTAPDRLERLHLMPTCGTQYWRHQDGEWVQIYAQNLSQEQIDRAMRSLETHAKELGLWEDETWGPILEDRGSQVTFSALGQMAPVDIKREWDPTGAKKNALRAAVQADLPDLEVRSGGSTSVDITRQGIDKAYGMQRLEEVSGIPIDDMLFIGDRLDPDGNDFPVKRTGVACHAVEGWEDTAEVVSAIIDFSRS